MEVRSMVVCSLVFAAVLYQFSWSARFLVASSPVLLLTAFLLGVVLVHSDDVPVAPEDEEHRLHIYKKIRHNNIISRGGGGGSSSDSYVSESDNGSSSGGVSSIELEDMMEEHLVDKDKEEDEEEEEVGTAAVAWTAEDEHSIRSIGSLELERDARLEKLMSRRSLQRHRDRNLIDLDVHIPAVLAPRKNPFDLLHADLPGSAPSSLLRDPFDTGNDDNAQRGGQEESADATMFRRHESFTAGMAPLVRSSSRFRPYFVAGDDKPIVQEGGGGGGGGGSNDNSSASSSSSSSSSSAAGSEDHRQKQQEAEEQVKEAAAAAEESSAAAASTRNVPVVSVDVELISDSSDDDMTLPGDDIDDSFEVESITQQVAAGKQQQPPPPRMSQGMASSRVFSRLPPLGQRPPVVEKRQEEQEASSSSNKEEGGAASVEEEEREREVSRSPPAVDSSSSSPPAGVAVVAPAAAPSCLPKPSPAPAAAAASPSPAPASGGGWKAPSTKYKVPKKVPGFGFFRNK